MKSRFKKWSGYPILFTRSHSRSILVRKFKLLNHNPKKCGFINISPYNIGHFNVHHQLKETTWKR